jgi:hypothetical protein
MPERIERIERIERRLAELRALLERVEQKHLEADDWEMVDALLAEVIEQAKPGQEWLTIGVSEEEAFAGRTSGTVGVEDSTSENPRQPPMRSRRGVR